MLGAIVGDIVGSVYEFNNHRSVEFRLFGKGCKFTDDSVLTIATAVALMDGKDFAETYRDFSVRYPDRGYGVNFQRWVREFNRGPYGSMGNGSAMRVSPVAWHAKSLEEALELAKKSSEVTHNDPRGIEGAQAVAGAIFLAREGASAHDLKSYWDSNFPYPTNLDPSWLREHNAFDETCPKTLPPVITAILNSNDFEQAVRMAVSLGGDTDTIAAITGSIAEALYGVPKEIGEAAKSYLPDELTSTVSKWENHLKIHRKG